MKKETEKKNFLDNYDFLANAASVNECTGLIPTPASTFAERESYDAIFHYRETPAEPNHEKS